MTDQHPPTASTAHPAPGTSRGSGADPDDRDPLRVGVVGAGVISAQYSLAVQRLPQLRVVAVADAVPERAEALAAEHDGARALDVPGLLAADDVDVVLGLTLPAGHADVALQALAAGKAFYGEKPLATTSADALTVVEAARRAGRRVGCAPDTVLGTGVQTARALVDAGEIGVPHAATATMTTAGHERWHPNPDFYYQPGGGPLQDMGPYYLTALVHLLGPVVRVTGLSARPRDERVIGSGPREGERVGVTTDTHVTGVLEHASGALTTLVMSFDAWASRTPPIEVHGTEGSLSVPDPNHFDGTVEVARAARQPLRGAVWDEVPPRAGYLGAGRGYGLADLALALRTGAPHRASAEVALHVVDVMARLEEASATGASVATTTTCERPAPVEGLVELAGATTGGGPRG
ncbi:Gfo/Idh/MocA family oxidoreductase [uncultured Pseudokineococcus sp.]|uniref:Gfo/Idh/MocA family protein n=1 Tax=uncultured Pseudokineococcus sp. TaxID=1642928 RepID=UPI00261EEEC3|nr:Gfo/Idh/MocA family oxidoreductase [uncultured Pseudokineococcus sp.]